MRSKDDEKVEIIAIVILVVIGIMVYMSFRLSNIVSQQKRIIEELSIIEIQLQNIERNINKRYKLR